MSATLKILVPEATINYIQNPSMRYDTTGWNAVGSSISRVLTYALFGIASLMISTSGLANNEGAYYRISSLLGISEPITASIYARGTGTVRIRLWNTAGKEWASQPVSLRVDRWTRLEVSGYSTGTDDLRLYIETPSLKPATTFYTDGAQLERKTYSTSFCDGDQPGCRWNIMDCASNPSRSASTRQGGKWIELAGPCRESDNIYVTTIGGMGMAPLQNNIQSWALSPGSYFQNNKILDRVITFAFTVKNKNLRMISKPDLSKLHELRQQLIDIFKPDVTGGNEPFILSYKEGDRELFIPVRYEAGLEGDWDIRNSWVNSFPLRLLAVDPMFYENNYHAQELKFKDNNHFVGAYGRIDGKWNSLNYGMNGLVYNLKSGKLNQIISAGAYTIVNYDVNALDPNRLVSNISYYDGIKWNAMVSGADGTVISVAVAPNGDIYATGTFLNIGGVAANYIAKWNGASWSALGTGLDNNGQCVAVAPNGDVYVGGFFHTAGGITAWHIAKWNGATWSSIGPYAGLDNDVYSIAISKDGTIVYVGGRFTQQYGYAVPTLVRIAQYNPSTDTLGGFGQGVNDTVLDIEISDSGTLYICGNFTLSGTTPMSRIARWNGSAWISLGAVTIDNNVNQIEVIGEENVVAAGDFTTIGNRNYQGLALWNGSVWTNLDILVDYSPVKFWGLSVAGEDIYVGNKFSYTSRHVYTSSINTVINHGTTEVKPIIYVYGPGHFSWIENQTNKKRIYMDMTILDNEEVFIDFGKGKVFSTVRGDLTYAVLLGSDFADFSLMPGNNTLAVFMTDDVDSKMMIYYRPQHWSADSTINAEALP